VSYLWAVSSDDDGLAATLTRYVETARELGRTFEMVIVSNALPPASERTLVEGLERARVPGRILRLHRAADEAAALSAGFREVHGEYVVVLPEYLQIEPRDAGRLIALMEDPGLHYVASWRNPRVDSRRAAWTSDLFNRLTRRMTGTDLHDINSGLRAMRRQVIEEVTVYGDLYRFLPVLAAMRGFRVGEAQVRHLSERVRRGDYRFGVWLRRALDLLTLFFLTKFTRKPLRFFGLVGTAAIVPGVLLAALVAFQRVLGQPLAGRPLFIIAVLFLVLGVQLFSIGLVGELIIFTHARETTEYQIDKVFESAPPPS
jgi:hypothetical protein